MLPLIKHGWFMIHEYHCLDWSSDVEEFYHLGIAISKICLHSYNKMTTYKDILYILELDIMLKNINLLI